MITAHLPAGYLVGRLLTGPKRIVLVATTIGGVLPDVDLLYFYTVGACIISHHHYPTHWPLFWLAVLGVPIVIWHLADWRRHKRGLMADRLTALRQAFRRNDLAYELVSAGAYFAYLRHPFGDQPSAGVARRLADDHNVLCMPGGMFGPGQESYLRFAFANLEAEHMEPLAQRLIESQG